MLRCLRTVLRKKLADTESEVQQLGVYKNTPMPSGIVDSIKSINHLGEEPPTMCYRLAQKIGSLPNKAAGMQEQVRTVVGAYFHADFYGHSPAHSLLTS